MFATCELRLHKAMNLCERDDIVHCSSEPPLADQLQQAVISFSFFLIITSSWHSCLAVKVCGRAGMQAAWRCQSPVTLPALLPRDHTHSNDYGIVGVGWQGSTCLTQSPRTTPGVAKVHSRSVDPQKNRRNYVITCSIVKFPTRRRSSLQRRSSDIQAL